MKKTLLLSALLSVSSIFSTVSFAGTIDCSLDSVSLEKVTVIGDTSETNQLSTSYDSTSCVGMFRGQDFLYGNTRPENNIGELNDGLLNGEGYGFDGMEFIDVDDLQDLDGDDNATDPGWIHLADVWNTRRNGFSSTYDTAGPSSTSDIILSIDDLLTLTFGCERSRFGFCQENSGFWELETKLTVIDDAQSLLGDATFDHLAFSINSSTNFAVYDFNFKNIFAQESNPALNFNTPYSLSGKFNMDDFPGWFGDQQPLHINVWARDPAEVPEPESLAILALGLVGLALNRKKRIKK